MRNCTKPLACVGEYQKMNLGMLFLGNLNCSGGLSLRRYRGKNLKWPKLQMTDSAGEWQMVVVTSPVTKNEHSSKEKLEFAFSCVVLNGQA